MGGLGEKFWDLDKEGVWLEKLNENFLTDKGEDFAWVLLPAVASSIIVSIVDQKDMLSLQGQIFLCVCSDMR